MFSYKSGPFTQYNSNLFLELYNIDNSQYIFEAEVIHAYEDSSYNELDSEQLSNVLSKDIEDRNLTVHKVVTTNDKSSGGWPVIDVRNTRPMTLKQFIDIINETYFQEDYKYLLTDCLEIFSIIKEV